MPPQSTRAHPKDAKLIISRFDCGTSDGTEVRTDGEADESTERPRIAFAATSCWRTSRIRLPVAILRMLTI